MLAVASTVCAQDEAPLNFEDHILPTFREYCIGCHRGSRARNGFEAGSVAALLEGGSSGAGIIPGDASGSLVYQLVARTRQPYMPYEDDPMPAELVETLRRWIDEGARETGRSEPLVRKPTLALAPVVPSADNRPAVPAMPPAELTRDPAWWSPRGTAVTAITASPWAPLVAVAGHRQVVLYDARSWALLGVLDHPEGAVQALRSSRDGTLLIAGGGRAGDSGRVVGWDVATSRRVFEIGTEPDAVLAADVSNDHALVALGGPDSVVRVHDVGSGAVLYEREDHTDWITALAFSPDGVLLATADRAGGVFVWEAVTGREFHELPPLGGMVTAMTWRADSMVVTVAGDDGAVRSFEMQGGSQVASFPAGAGVLDLATTPDGRLVTAARTPAARITDARGGGAVTLPAMSGLTTAVAAIGAFVVCGDTTGDVGVFENGTRIATLAVNPDPPALRRVRDVTARIARLEALLPDLEAAATAARAPIATLEAAATTNAAALDEARSVTGATAADVDRLAGQLGPARITEQAAGARRADADALLADLDARLAAALDRAAVAEAAMLATLAQTLETETETQDETSAALRKRLEGETAIARLAATDVADLEISRALAAAAQARHAAIHDALAAALAHLADEHAAAVAESQRRADAERRLLEAANEIALQLDAAHALAANEAAALAEARSGLASARTEAAAAAAAWETRRHAIEAAGGRVRANID